MPTLSTPIVSMPEIVATKPVQTYIPPQNQMSLGDIVNMAATMQSYQKQKELMPYQIAAGKAQSEQAQIEAKKAGIDLQQHNANISRGVLGGLLSDPDFINGNSDSMIKKLQRSREFLRSVGVESPDGGKRMEQLIEDARTNPQAVYQEIKNGVQQAGGAAAQYTTQQQFQPTQLYQGGGQPAAGGVPQPTGAPGAPAGGQAPAPQQGRGMNLPFPVRNPNQPYAPFPQEAAAVTSGESYYKGLSDFGVNSVKYKRNVDEVIDKAKEIEQKATFPTGGALGAAERKAGVFLGTEQGVNYRQLSKDLANVQIAALQAAGGDLQTDAGKQLVAMANGDVTYPPKVLIDIANRTKADITNVDLQRQAADKFYRQYGANNMSAFKQVWADNADSKVFQAINIYKQEGLSPEQKKAEIDKLMGSDESKRKEFYQKYQNINKLVNTGSL